MHPRLLFLFLSMACRSYAQTTVDLPKLATMTSTPSYGLYLPTETVSFGTGGFAGDIFITASGSRLLKYSGFSTGHTGGIELESTTYSLKATYGSYWDALGYHGWRFRNGSASGFASGRFENNNPARNILEGVGSAGTLVATLTDAGSLSVSGALSAASFSAPTATLTTSVSSAALLSPGSTNSSTIRAGSLEMQSYSLSNAWLGDNMYYNSGFIHRATGPASGLFLLGTEHQTRFSASQSAGVSSPTMAGSAAMKLSADGSWGVGGSLSTTLGAFNGAGVYYKGSTTNLMVGTITDDAVNKLQVSGAIKAVQYRLSALNTAPASATDTGTTGEIRVTAGFIFVAIATNTWVRAPLSTW